MCLRAAAGKHAETSELFRSQQITQEDSALHEEKKLGCERLFLVCISWILTAAVAC